MRLEAIAALLGHRKMEMTLIYARIANRVVADEYAAVSAKIDALYGQQPDLPADYETTGMARLRREAHARMLGNGLCTRPVELDCRMESACETCAYFRTGAQFLPILTRQRDHAQQHGQPERAALFDGLIQRVETPRRERPELIAMPDIRLNHGDAIELAELFTFLADWLTGSQHQTLADSLARFVGHDRYTVDELRADLHRFVFLLGLSDGEELFGDTTS